MGLMREVVSMGKWIPGEIDGKSVNIRCYIEIDMMDEQLNEFAKHPAFDKDRPIKKNKIIE